MRVVVITIGIPGSGKSTWAKQQLVQEPKRWKRLNRDDMRSMLDASYSPDNEKFINLVQESTLKQALDAGYDVIVDNTHLSSKSRKAIHDICKRHGNVVVIERMFQTSLQTCLERNATRQAIVPEAVIQEMHQKYSGMLNRGPAVQEFRYEAIENTEAAILEQDPTLPKAILCDLDGTLALMGDRSPFDASQCDLKDKPNWSVIECVKAMYEKGVSVIFMSGRMDKDREPSARFIEKWVRVPANWAFEQENDDRPKDLPIRYELHMRATGDTRKDNIVKRDLFDLYVRDRFNVLFVLDDRDQVVEGWRRMGLSCFQVNPGSF